MTLAFVTGVVQTLPRARKCMVRFPGGRKKLVFTDEMFPNSGSVPCPVLRPGECVLVRVRARNLADSDIYLPAVVGTVPENPRSAAGLHTVTAFGGKMLICTRRAMVKLTRPKYKQVCDQLAIRLQARKESMTNSILDAYLKEHAQKEMKVSIASKQKQGHLNLSDGNLPQRRSSICSSTNESPAASSPKHSPIPLCTSSPVAGSDAWQLVEGRDAGQSQTKTENNPSLPLTPPHTPLPQADAETIDQGTSTEPFLCDAGTNTMPLMESKGITTDPEKHDISLATDNFVNDSVSPSLPCSPPSSPHGSDHKVERSEKSTQLNIQDLEDSSQEASQLHKSPRTRGLISHFPSPTPNHPLLYNKSMIVAPLQNNMEVLARWLDDGWFYRSKLLDPLHAVDSSAMCLVCMEKKDSKTTPHLLP